MHLNLGNTVLWIIHAFKKAYTVSCMIIIISMIIVCSDTFTIQIAGRTHTEGKCSIDIEVLLNVFFYLFTIIFSKFTILDNL